MAQVGRHVTFSAGMSTGAAAGGNLILHPGAGDTGGTSGSVIVQVNSDAGAPDTNAIVVDKDGAITFNVDPNSFTFPSGRGEANQVLTDVDGNGTLTWEDVPTTNMGTFGELTNAAESTDSVFLPRETDADVPAGTTNNTVYGFQDTAGTAYAGDAITTGAVGNSLFGASAGQVITDGDSNTCIGALSGAAISSGSTNTMVGHSAGPALSTNSNSTCIGANAGKVLTAAETTLVGADAGAAITSGTGNTAVGYQAGSNNVSGIGNTAVGHIAGRNMIGGTNTVIGSSAAAAAGATLAGNNNLIIGAEAVGTGVFTGGEATVVGTAAANALTTAAAFTAVGYDAGSAFANQANNTVVGHSAGQGADGADNTIIGAGAGTAATGGTNTIIGAGAAATNAVAGDATIVGAGSGTSITGVQNTVLGAAAGTTLINGENCTVIGYGATASGEAASHEITLGNASVNALRCADTTIASLSDRRDKTDIVDSTYGEEFINRLRPTQYMWQTREGSSKDGKTRVGFIAQELLEAMPNGENEILDLVYEINEERLEAKYGNLIPVMAKAIQELSAKVAALEAAAAQA